MDKYIRILETYLRFSPELGWEHFRLRKFPAIRMAYIAIVILVLNLAAGVMGSRVIGIGPSRFAGSIGGNRIVYLLHSAVGAFTLSPEFASAMARAL